MKLFILLVAAASVVSSSDDGEDFFLELSEALNFTSSDVVSPASACQIDINANLGNPQPLFVRPGASQFFHPTDRRGIIEMSASQEMELFCTNGFATPSGVTANLIRISCSSGTRVIFNGISHNFNEFTCRSWPTSVAQRRVTTTRCFNQSTIVDVGFQVENRFLRVFSACHNPRTEQNYFAEYQLTPASDGQERSVTRPGWRQGDFYPGKNVDNLHTRATQTTTIGVILNSQSQADIFIEPPNSDIFLARGHMAAMTDFITANEQRSTFFFINTAPQWQRFNALNWLAVEMSTRRLASDRNIFLNVVTGTTGITHLPDVAGRQHEIFLDFPARQVTVPMIFYKIIVNPADQSGVVFIGVNNPHLSLSEILQNYVLCTDVSDRINYVNWQRTDIRRGYSYACDVNDFLRRVPHVTGINVSRLLV